MDFQETLKSNIRDKSDIAAEQAEQRKKELSIRANSVLSRAKTCLINDAKSGNYEIIEGKTVISTSIPLHSEYFHLIIEKTPYKYKRKAFGRLAVAEPAKIISTLEIDPNMSEDFNYFYQQLKNMADSEKITVKGYYVENSVKHIKEKLPYTLEDTIFQLFKHDWVLKVEFEAIVNN